MAGIRTKTISYHRAEYFIAEPATISLSMCIKQTVDKLPDANQRTVVKGDGRVMRLADIRSDAEGGHYLYIVVDTPGEHASIVPKVPSGIKRIAVSTVSPPNDAEFMDGDAFLYVRSNDICMCTTTIKAGTIRDFLQSFFREAAIRKDAVDFEFMNALDPNKIEMIMKKGVKEIDINGVMHRASVDYARRKAQPVGILDLARKHFNAVAGFSPDNVSPDGINVKIVLKTDARSKGHSIGESKLETIAVEVIKNQQDIDEYSIITNDGQKINPSEIILHSKVDLPSVGKSVEQEHAWAALINYYNDLVSRSFIVK
jgi:hypothetical protein